MIFWAFVLALSALLYVLLDGFDLGVGILYAFVRDPADRRRMLAAISPVWDGNETWLVMVGAVMFGAFPRAFATLLSAFYLPIIVMLGALALRGVSFEFRHRTLAYRWVWDLSFAAGSLIAAFIQGAAVGALVHGLPFAAGQYAGGALGWLSPFALLCGLGLSLGYALLGAAWLVGKAGGALRVKAAGMVAPLALAVAAFLAVAFVYALGLDLRIMARWLERPYLIVFPIVGAIAAVQLFRQPSSDPDSRPFRSVCVVFAAAFATLAISFWPYVIPFELTLNDAVAPRASLDFMFWGAGVFVLPLVLAYTGYVYWLFRGSVSEEGQTQAHPVVDYSKTYPENN